jgi:CheY-like chemotaxis protein
MRKPRVIIFDDNAIYLELLELYFTGLGYDVFSYSTPMVCPRNETFADSCIYPYACADVLISDFKMPTMNGVELLQLQSKKGCKIDIKMKAIMSDFTNEEVIAECDELGCRYFEKPLNFSALAGWLSECKKHFDLSRQLADKRLNRRYEWIQAIEYCLNPIAAPEKLIGLTIDKSNDGLGLRVFVPLRAGQEITIISGSEVPNLNGTVVWCTQLRENIYSAGLRLLKSS